MRVSSPFLLATLAATLFLMALPSRADVTWTPYQVLYNGQPSGTIEISYSAGNFKYDGGGMQWSWKIKSTYQESVEGEIEVDAVESTSSSKLSTGEGGFTIAPNSEQTQGDRAGQWTIGTSLVGARLVGLRVGDRVIIAAGRKPSTPTSPGANPPGVNVIEFPGKASDSKMGPDENYSGWKPLEGGSSLSARARRLGPKTAGGQFAWGYEVKNNSTQNQRFTLKVTGARGQDARQETILLGAGEVYRGQYTSTEENQISLQVSDVATGANTLDIGAKNAPSPAAPPPPALDEKAREAKLEELNEKLLAGLAEMNPADPNASLSAMNAVAEQMWSLMENDPDSDTKKMVSLLRQFFKADADAQTVLLTQLMELLMTLMKD